MKAITKLMLLSILAGFFNNAFCTPPRLTEEEKKLSNELRIKLPPGMYREIEKIPEHLAIMKNLIDGDVSELKNYSKVKTQTNFMKALEDTLSAYTDGTKSKHDLQTELRALEEQERSSHGEMGFKNQTAQSEFGNRGLNRIRKIANLQSEIKKLDNEDIDKFKEALKTASPTQDFFALTNSIINKEAAVQALEAQWDQTLLGIYTSQRLNKLLDSEPFCKRASECAQSGGKIEQSRSRLKGVFEKQGNHD